MGHRALVAYERSTGDYAIRYSHWGAHEYRLLEAITPRTPFGRDEAVSDAVALGTDPGSGAETTTTPLVEREPLGTARDRSELARDFVDPVIHEAVYTVSIRFDVDVMHPVPFRPPGTTAPSGGALVSTTGSPEPEQVDRELLAWQRGRSAPPEDGSGSTASENGHVSSRIDAGHDHSTDRFSRWFDSLRSAIPSCRVYPIQGPDPESSIAARASTD